jgi:glycosyltransferase involved in cell wall biosynthesis
VIVLDDYLARIESKDSCRGFVLFPLSYANDEPVDEILEAARALPSVEFVMTGNAPSAVIDAAPSNVLFTGFLSHEAYSELVQDAALVGALTNRPHTMQRAGYEALERSKPILTTDTEALRHYYGDFAVYADRNNSSESIVSALTRVLTEPSAYTGRVKSLLEIKLSAQELTLEELIQELAY